MAILKLVEIEKKFGGLKAIENLSFEVEEGEVLGLIGPNGAGKTTAFNLITSFLRPDKGDIIFSGRSILDLKPHDVCRLGLSRTFQIVRPFPGLTVLENVMAGAFRVTKDVNIAKKEALRILEFLQLFHLRDMKAASLTLSNRKRIEIARALATKPKLLLLDEPMGGMNPREVEIMLREIERIRDSSITLVIIEHVMRAMMTISNRIVVLNHGQKIFEGTPKGVSGSREVIKAYLGEEYSVS
jgi:branched-chain amino acid transport system ATP-binding protein